MLSEYFYNLTYYNFQIIGQVFLGMAIVFIGIYLFKQL